MKLKLEEYKKRAILKGKPWNYGSQQSYARYRSACYKAHVLELVIKSEKLVDTLKLNKEMAIEHGRFFNAEEFENACVVVNLYCRNLADVIIGGTGLPELPKIIQTSGQVQAAEPKKKETVLSNSVSTSADRSYNGLQHSISNPFKCFKKRSSILACRLRRSFNHA